MKEKIIRGGGSYSISEVDINWFLGINNLIDKSDIISQHTMSQILKIE